MAGLVLGAQLVVREAELAEGGERGDCGGVGELVVREGEVGEGGELGEGGGEGHDAVVLQRQSVEAREGADLLRDARDAVVVEPELPQLGERAQAVGELGELIVVEVGKAG